MMDCQQVRLTLSAFQDGRVLDDERRAIEQHLAGCAACAERLEQLELVRQSLRSLPRRPVPPRVQFALRSLASKEAARRRYYAGLRGALRAFGERASLWANNLMRPVALPAAGGLVSAVFLFTLVLTNFQGIVREHPNDVPLAVVTAPTVRSVLFDLSDDSEVTLDVFVDEQGRVLDFVIPESFGSVATHEMRRRLAATLLMTYFNPATAFGQPVSGWVRVKFRGRSEIYVRG
jgi:ferric-dicitrate binding protein FerR (iron transport regulator)